MVFCTHGGLDELAPDLPARGWWVSGGQIERVSLLPGKLGLASGEVAAPRDVAESTAMFRAVLGGDASAALTDLVALNAGAALWVAEAAEDLLDGLSRARAEALPLRKLEAEVVPSQRSFAAAPAGPGVGLIAEIKERSARGPKAVERSCRFWSWVARTPPRAWFWRGPWAGVLEFGFAFSAPPADGPVIRAADQRALAAGMTPARSFELLAELRRARSQPFTLLVYYNLLLRLGLERF